MGSLIVEALRWVLETLVGAFLFLTGEVLRYVATLGKHRVRWWDAADGGLGWSSVLLGVLFWFAAGALVWFWLH